MRHRCGRQMAGSFSIFPKDRCAPQICTRSTWRMGQPSSFLIRCSAIWRPWTFIVERRGVECGRIVKQWSGLVREACTDADNFGVEFRKNLDTKHKVLLLAAVFLIDFLHFEQKGGLRSD